MHTNLRWVVVNQAALNLQDSLVKRVRVRWHLRRRARVNLGLSAEQLAQTGSLQGAQLGMSANQFQSANAQALAQTGHVY
jgi:hypothetical protein